MLMTMKKKSFTKGSSSNNRLKPGSYNSVVKKVEFRDDYDAQTGLQLFYELTDEDGRTYEFKELFFNVPGNPRTEALGEYLEAAGIDTDDVRNWVGLRETLTIKWNIKGTNQFLTIVERKVLDGAGDDECNTK
ncbi:MAG: hypothetical protein E7400_03700 [Ruminococcaceae bacterium]|nr:hypothetical protein [Oscillospiraceae bacterium]